MDELKESKELESETEKADEKEEQPEKQSARTQQEEELNQTAVHAGVTGEQYDICLLYTSRCV